MKSLFDIDDVVLIGVIWLIVMSAAWVLFGCAPSAATRWTEMDTKNATDLAKASLALEAVCDREAGVCDPRFVRSVESGEFCAASSMMFRHNVPVLDGGDIRCFSEGK